MRLTVISFKECWRDADGRWFSSGGFPLQIAAIASLFDSLTLAIVETEPKPGGIALPSEARVLPTRRPTGENWRRKASVLTRLPEYVGWLTSAMRDADVVHTPLPGDLPLLGLATALALRKRTIARYGGSWAANAQTSLMNRLTRALMRSAAGGRNVMLATGDGAQPPAPRMEWIFSTAMSASELEGIRPRSEDGLASPPRLVYVGRLSPEKGVAVLVEAIRILREEGLSPMPTIDVVGDGPERRTLEAAAAGAGPGVFRFHGQLGREALMDALARADVCVQPSLTEGYSKAWLEALANGLPVLASDVGAARAVVGTGEERGWIVPPGDPAALAAALRRALSQPRDWAALRGRCRAYAEGRTLEAWSRRIAELCSLQWNGHIVGGRLRIGEA